MSCRIDRVIIADDLVVLRISGRIKGDDVDMLQALLDREPRAVAVDLKDVLLLDSEVVKFLALRESNGTEIRSCPPYIREWVTRERAEANTGWPDQGMGGESS